MGKTSNIINTVDLNPNYDIVWSFKFLLSSSNLTSQSQGGFVTYLVHTSAVTPISFSTGTSGAFLGYDGPPGGGIEGAILGVGFDTLGLFAVSGISSRTYGITSTEAKLNSVTVRGGYSDFKMLYNESLSALTTNFTLLTNTEDYQWLRIRLGNVGQTLYVDYRRYDNDAYKPMFELPVTLPVKNDSFYNVGLCFSYPLTSTDFSENQSDTIFRIKSFLVEGSKVVPDTYVYSTTSSAITALQFEDGTATYIEPDILGTQDEHIFLT